jgi:uncharacterized membrane protein
LVLVYSALSTTCLLVASFFALRGVWYILGFAVLEIFAVGVAFFLFARHATDREHITLTDDCLLVELIRREEVWRYRLDPRTTRVEPPPMSGGLIGLRSNGVKVEVGQFLTERNRREFARELRNALASER